LRLEVPEGASAGFVVVRLLLLVAAALAGVLLGLPLELVDDASAGLEVACSLLLVTGVTVAVLDLLLELAEGV
jgi:hypothetical protein